jgi:hypothetical protein
MSRLRLWNFVLDLNMDVERTVFVLARSRRGGFLAFELLYSVAEVMKYKTLKFLAEIIQFLLKSLPTCDDPVLNSRLFDFIWFAAILDKGVNSLRDLILPTESYRYTG